MKQSSHLIRAFVVLLVSLALGISARVTQAKDTPPAYTQSPNKSRTNANTMSHVAQERAFGKVQAAYFSNRYVMCCPRFLHSRHRPIEGAFTALISVCGPFGFLFTRKEI